jgi:hypothetical protein
MRAGSERLGAGCGENTGILPNIGTRASRGIKVPVCEFKEMFGADIAGS